MPRVKIRNWDLGTETVIQVTNEGAVSKGAMKRARVKLRTPIGYATAGPLGEVGNQVIQGVEYRFEQLEDGSIWMRPSAPATGEVPRA